MPKLRHLKLDGLNAENDDLEHFLSLKSFKQLKSLQITGCDKDLAMFKNSLQRLNL